MPPSFFFSRIKIQLNGRTIFSLLAAESILLSILQHRLNFWGLPWDKQALLILVVAPAVVFFDFIPVEADLGRLFENRKEQVVSFSPACAGDRLDYYMAVVFSAGNSASIGDHSQCGQHSK